MQGEPQTNDELSALLESRVWMRRRIDHLEFIDLTTVHRTITFSIDLEKLRPFLYGQDVLPIGLFRRGAGRTGTRLIDAEGNVVEYLTPAESDERVARALRARLQVLGIADEQCCCRLRQIREHSEAWCAALEAGGLADGWSSLATEKWGCPALGQLAQMLKEADAEREGTAAAMRLLFDWQNNFFLFVSCAGVKAPAGWGTLELSYDEELGEWQPPWERRTQALRTTYSLHSRATRRLGRRCTRILRGSARAIRRAPQLVHGREGTRRSEWLTRWSEGPPPREEDLSAKAERTVRRQISRGGPFSLDLDALFERSLRRCLTAWGPLWLRRVGRRGLLAVAWHVAWEQASSADVASHQVEVTVPPELTVVRLRMVERYRGDPEEYVASADALGTRAVVVAPTRKPHETKELVRLSPTFLSLVVTQRDRRVWLAAGTTALLTGVAIVLCALLRLPELISQTEATVTILLVAPSLGSALLAILAGGEIVSELTQRLRLLIAAIAISAIGCVIALVCQHTAPYEGLASALFGTPARRPDIGGLQLTWCILGCVAVIAAMVLFWGARELRRLAGCRDVNVPERRVDEGKALMPEQAPLIPPPDRWLQTGEGDRIPWGWLEPDRRSREKLEQTRSGHGRREDKRYWSVVYDREDESVEDRLRAAEELVKWREQLFTHVDQEPR